MAVCSFSLAADRFWTEDKERALIAFFSKHSCLWNHKSESYKNRQLRWKTLEHLRILLSAQHPPAPFTVEDIKNKFKNLRTTFQRQYKMVKASRASGCDDVFVSQWKHYQQLMFLQNCWDQEESPDDPQPPPPPPPPLPPHSAVSQEEPLKLESQPVLAGPGLIISFLPSTSTSTSSPSSSSSSSNTMGKCYWTEEKERALISFYSDHSCLWNKKCENHNNRQLRLRTLETLRSQLSEQQPVPFSVEDIKSKFKNLRTVFNREYKAVTASLSGSDRVYVSKWKHYQQLLFLCESCDEDDGSEDLQVLLSQGEKDLERGNQVNSNGLSSFPSGTGQTSTMSSCSAPSGFTCSPSVSGQYDSKANAAAPYRLFLSATPDGLKLAGQVAPSALPVSPSGSVWLDTKPSSGTPNPSPLNFSASSPVQPDARLSADARCHWTEAKVRELISFYSEHSCLWNHKSESYRNRQLRQSTMETLSRLLSDSQPAPFTVEDIKTKFRNLRTIFQREHKAVSSNKTCGSEDFYLPKWKHYRQLMFLCDSCDEDDGADDPDDLRFHQPQADGLLELGNQAPPSSLHYPASAAGHASQTDAKLNVAPRSHEAPPSPTPPASQLSSPSSSPSTSSSHADLKVSGRKRPSRSAPPAGSEALDFMRSFCQSATVSPHAGFLKYVEECLNETPPDKVKKLKKKIIETIHSVSEEL